MYQGVTPLLMLRPSAKQLRCFAAALAALALFFGLAMYSHDPDGCHPEKQGPRPEPFTMSQTVSPTTVNPFNQQCPGGPQFSTGDFKLR